MWIQKMKTLTKDECRLEKLIGGRIAMNEGITTNGPVLKFLQALQILYDFMT
jgi:hypothetical protein